MSKYDPLWKYIVETHPNALTFEDVERICGIPIDTTKLTPAFEVRLYTLYRQKQSRDIFKDHVLRKMGAKS